MAKATKETIDNETGEILETTAVTTSEKAAAGVMIAGQKFAVKALVNVPTLKHESGQTVAFQIIAPIIDSVNTIREEVMVPGQGKVMAEREAVISVVRVIQLSDGKTYEYVCNAISADNFRNAYPNDSYVGLYFAVSKGDMVPGKRYKSVQILELEPQV